MIKKVYSVIFLLLLCLSMISVTVTAEENAAGNLLKNPGMESGTTALASDWKLWKYNSEGLTTARGTENPYGGTYYLSVTAQSPNDVRFIQTVRVKPETTYKVTGAIRAENVGKDKKGVNISLLDYLHTSRDLQGSTSWQEVELYFKTGDDTENVTIGLSLGGYANTNTGTAYFDNISMTEIKTPPANAAMFYIPSKKIPSQTNNQTNTSAGKKLRPPSILMATLISMLLLAGCMVLIIIWKKKGNYPKFIKEDWIASLPAFKTEATGIKGYLFSPYVKFAFLFIIAFLFMLDLFNSFNTEPINGFENQYVYQAQAILNGKIEISKYLHDAAIYQGKYYVIYPPFPVVILLPFVALFGMKTEVTMISAVMTIISAFLLYRVLVRLDIKKKNIPWLIAAYLGGTTYWFCFSRAYGVCFFAHVCAAFATILALDETFGKGRGLLVGLYIGMAFLSRQLAIFFFFFFAMVLLDKKKEGSQKNNLLNLGLMCASLAVSVGIYFWYNYIRFGNIFDTGYSYLKLPDFMAQRVSDHGQFSFAFFPFNFIYTFIQGFHFEFDYPKMLKVIHIDRFGTSLTFASPFLFFALKAKWKKSYLIGAWISILIMLMLHLTYYNNGWVQYNSQRFSLDYIPLLIVLVALGIKNNISEKIWKPAIIYSLAFNAISLWVVLPDTAKKLF